MTVIEVKEFTERIRQDVRAFRTRLAEAETPSPSWNAFKPEVQAELVLKKRDDVLSGLRLDLSKLRKSLAEKHAEIRKDRYHDLYPDTASGSPLRKEDARYYDWRAHALLGVGIESQMKELRGLLEVGEEGEYSTRVYDWLKLRPLSEGERIKFGIEHAVLLTDFETRRGFKEFEAIEKHFTAAAKDLEEAGTFLALPPDLQRRPTTFADFERQQEALGR